jgi:hypothetical protein
MNKNDNVDIAVINLIKDDEPLGRYIFSKSHFSSENNKVKSSAFMPPADLQLSVFRTQGLDEKTIWNIAENEIIKKSSSPNKLYGRAEILSFAVKSTGLELDPNNIPPRHANIIGWPQEKAKQKMIAIELATKASLVLKA